MNRVLQNAKDYLGNDVQILPSTRKDSKFMVRKPSGSWVHFGAKGYDDFTQHNDPERQRLYLLRSGSIRGDWRQNKYSPNNLSRNILWR
jgi:hypothetical protein